MTQPSYFWVDIQRKWNQDLKERICIPVQCSIIFFIFFISIYLIHNFPIPAQNKKTTMLIATMVEPTGVENSIAPAIPIKADTTEKQAAQITTAL